MAWLPTRTEDVSALLDVRALQLSLRPRRRRAHRRQNGGQRTAWDAADQGGKQRRSNRETPVLPYTNCGSAWRPAPSVRLAMPEEDPRSRSHPIWGHPGSDSASRPTQSVPGDLRRRADESYSGATQGGAAMVRDYSGGAGLHAGRPSLPAHQRGFPRNRMSERDRHAIRGNGLPDVGELRRQRPLLSPIRAAGSSASTTSFSLPSTPALAARPAPAPAASPGSRPGNTQANTMEGFLSRMQDERPRAGALSWLRSVVASSTSSRQKSRARGHRRSSRHDHDDLEDSARRRQMRSYVYTGQEHGSAAEAKALYRRGRSSPGGGTPSHIAGGIFFDSEQNPE